MSAYIALTLGGTIGGFITKLIYFPPTRRNSRVS